MVVLDSDKPVVIMPNNNSIETTSSQLANSEIIVDTTDNSSDKDIDNITELLKKTKPKRDDGIELIINNDKDIEKEKEKEEDFNEKKKN